MTFTGLTAEADRRRAAFLDAVDAVFRHGSSVARATGSLDAGAAIVRGHIAHLRAVVLSAGGDRAETDAFIAKLDLTPESIRQALGGPASGA